MLTLSYWQLGIKSAASLAVLRVCVAMWVLDLVKPCLYSSSGWVILHHQLHSLGAPWSNFESAPVVKAISFCTLLYWRRFTSQWAVCHFQPKEPDRSSPGVTHKRLCNLCGPLLSNFSLRGQSITMVGLSTTQNSQGSTLSTCVGHFFQMLHFWALIFLQQKIEFTSIEETPNLKFQSSTQRLGPEVK